jgi:cytochrome c biogenesis protein CcmG, thiol:disulfide interchange protein DsbE
MKNHLQRCAAVVALAALTLLLPRAPVAASPVVLGVGKPAPAFAVTDVNGNKILSRQFAGHPIFMNFFASWCPPCKLELPEIVKRYPQFKDRVVFLGLDQEESLELIQPFIKQFAIKYQVGVDQGQVAAAYSVQVLPQSVFIDRHGIVRAVRRGYLPPHELLVNLERISGR